MSAFDPIENLAAVMKSVENCDPVHIDLLTEAAKAVDRMEAREEMSVEDWAQAMAAQLSRCRD